MSAHGTKRTCQSRRSISAFGGKAEIIEGVSSEIEVLARRDVDCERLMSGPGIGPIISSAMVAAIGSGDAFSKGRDFAAWLGRHAVNVRWPG
jgi:transposase